MADVAAVLVRLASAGAWGQYHGEELPNLERELSHYFAGSSALTCASGTLACEIALRAVGVQAGSEVILAAYEYEPTFLTLHALGAVPVLVDVDPRTGNLDASLVEAALSPKTVAVVASHLHGGTVDLRLLKELQSNHPFKIVEDAAQCPGATLAASPAGTTGDVGVLSFGGSKLLSAGRGGAVLTRDLQTLQRAKLLLSRGVQSWGTLSELQAAVVRPQLARLPREHANRIRQIALLDERLREMRGLRRFQTATPSDRPDFYKIGFWYEATATGLSRELFCHAMRAEGCAVDPGFRSLHIGRAKSRYRAAGELPHATALSEQCVVVHHPILRESVSAIEQFTAAVVKTLCAADELRAAFPTVV